MDLVVAHLANVLVVGALAVLAGAGLLFLGTFLLYPSRTCKLAVSPLPVFAAIRTGPAPQAAAEMYVDLLKGILTRGLVAQPYERHSYAPDSKFLRLLYAGPKKLLAMKSFELTRLRPSDPAGYLENGYRHADAEVLVGTRQLDNIHYCITDVLRREVPGDLIEAGVYRGGSAIFMRGVLKACGDKERKVWVADSFQGLPDPDPGLNPAKLWGQGDMAVALEVVKDNFARYGLLDDNVCFLKGFFSDTLPKAPITKLAVLRIDADLYESTMDALSSLYPRLSVGGYVILDDYLNLADCRRAIDDYREAHGIVEQIQPIDSMAVYWQKQADLEAVQPEGSLFSKPVSYEAGISVL